MAYRYYVLRQRVSTSANEFFVTNQGKRLTKLNDDVNKSFGVNVSACIFRKMIETQSRGHDKTTSANVARSLQHSEETALRYYQLPDVGEAIRRQRDIGSVDQTALFEVAAMEE